MSDPLVEASLVAVECACRTVDGTGRRGLYGVIVTAIGDGVSISMLEDADDDDVAEFVAGLELERLSTVTVVSESDDPAAISVLVCDGRRYVNQVIGFTRDDRGLVVWDERGPVELEVVESKIVPLWHAAARRDH